jgi:glutamate dehydrogenase
MFALPRSSWDDYDKQLISKGGGVFPRSAKAIPVSPEAAAVLGISAGELAPPDLLRAILKAPVDLLYNGGIGTYVKAASQSNAEVGDRANDAIRVNGSDLRCKVVGEGGNLGFTQLGRVEFAQHGGRIYTDAIDNSAGVDCSDHEVNIKILVGLVMSDGEMTLKQRNKLLAEMTDDVSRLVLVDNYYQPQSLSVSGVRGEKLLDSQAAFIRALEKAGRLNRAVEFLPSDDEIAERRAAKQGLTAPERAVLLAYSKMALFDDLLTGTLVDDEYVARTLVGYFPTLLQQRYTDVMPRHPLKREIIATVVANTMINRTGSIFVHRMLEETGASSEEVTRAYVLVRDIFGLDPLWQGIDALDNRVPAQLQYEMLVEVGRLVVRATLWFLRRRRERLPIAQVLDLFRPALEKLQGQAQRMLSAGDRAAFDATVSRLAAEAVPREIAERVASLNALYAVLDVTEVAMEQKKSVESVAALYFALVGELDLRWFSDRITQLPTDTNWQALARNALRDDLASQQRALTSTVAKLSDSADPAAMLAAWRERYAPAIARLKSMIEELKRQGNLDLAVLSVLLRELRSLA